MSETGYVYTLNDPRTGEPKYVGATVDPHNRLNGHQNGSTNADVTNWISELEQEGLTPKMTLIEVARAEELADAEQAVISRLSEEWELLNGELSTKYSTANIKDTTTDTAVHITNEARNALRRYKAEEGLTYSEAILQLIDENDSFKFEVGE